MSYIDIILRAEKYKNLVLRTHGAPVDTLEFLHVAWVEFLVSISHTMVELSEKLASLSQQELLFIAGLGLLLQFAVILWLIHRQRKMRSLTMELNEELSLTEAALIRERLWRRAGGSNSTTISEVEIEEMLVSLGYVTRYNPPADRQCS